MLEIDPFVKALADLCEREGGYAFVADKAKVNADGLWQILNGVKLPSGNPRGVGPGTRKKITAAYPDWLDARKSISNPHHANGDSAQFATELVANNLPYLQNMQLVAELARRIRAIPRDQRSAIERELVALVMSPDSEETCAALSHGLSFGDEALPTTTKEMNKNSRETHDAKSDTGKDIVRS